MTEDAQYKLLNLLEADPRASQREMACGLDVSLGKVNYCLLAMIEKGHVEAKKFRSSQKKTAYLYLLTPRGVKAKARITAGYLQIKIDEYKRLRAEIEELEAEVGAHRSSAS